MFNVLFTLQMFFFRTWNKCNLISRKINRVTPTQPLWTNSANRDQRDAIDMLLQRVHTEITKTTCYCFDLLKATVCLSCFTCCSVLDWLGTFARVNLNRSCDKVFIEQLTNWRKRVINEYGFIHLCVLLWLACLIRILCTK